VGFRNPTLRIGFIKMGNKEVPRWVTHDIDPKGGNKPKLPLMYRIGRWLREKSRKKGSKEIPMDW